MKIKERDLILNEEILNQIRLMNFDRSMTLIEQSLRKVEISGKLTTIGGEPPVRVPCKNCYVNLIEDNITNNKKTKETPYYENLWNAGEVNINYINNTRTDNEGNFYLNVNTEPGMYALIMGGGMAKDDTTIYFDIIQSQNKNFGTIDLPEALSKINDVTLFGGVLKTAFDEYLKKVEEYNNLQNSNSTYRWNTKFPSPATAPKPTGGWTPKEIKKYTDGVERGVKALKNNIKKGEDYLKETNELTDTSKLKPLDVINRYMTKNGYGTMNELRYIDNSSSSVFMGWYRNDGQFSDPNTYKLSDEEIKYIRDGWKRKLESSMQLIDSALLDMTRAYHDYAPYIAMALYLASIVFPPAGYLAVGIESVDSLIYAVYDKDYYMAGLTAAFAIWGAADMGLFSQPAKIYYKTALRFEERKFVSQKAKKELHLFLKTNTPQAIKIVLKKSKELLIKLFNLIFKSAKNAIKGLKFLNDKINFLPNWLQNLVKQIGKMLITLGGVIWTWDKLASYMGLCNSAPFSLAYATWDDKEHWWISNLLLSRLVGFMGAFQTSTTSCQEKEMQIAALEVHNSLSEQNQEELKNFANSDQNNNEMKKIASQYHKQIQDKISLNKKTLEQGKKELLNKSKDETSSVIEKVEMFDESFSETFSGMLIDLHKQIEAEDEQD